MSEPAEGNMHDVISEAFDASSEAPGSVDEPEVSPVAPVVEQTQNDDVVVAPEHAPEAQVGNIEQPPVADASAPQSWGVAEREGWNGLSPEIQAQIDKREKEISNSLTTTGEARQFHEEFNQAVAPFQHFIQAEGATPLEAVSGLLQTAATLQGGTPQQKAVRIAELVQHYGIDIRSLDKALAGTLPNDTEENRFSEMLDSKLKPMQDFMNYQQQQQQQTYQAEQTSRNTEIDTFFTQHEFANDVRTTMADLMEMAGRRNEPLSLDKAYEQAIMLRPDIQQVIQQRTNAANAGQNNQRIANKSNAAVSVSGGQTPMGGTPAPDNMRDAIVAAMGNG